MNTSILSLQVALFFEVPTMRPDLIATQINLDMDNFFDNMPTIIPLPDNLPVDTPSVMMSSSRFPFQVNYSKTRVDFLVNRTISEDIIDVDSFKRHAKIFIDTLIKKMKIIRIGVITNVHAELEDCSKYIRNKFIKNSELKNSGEFMLRFNTHNRMGKHEINNLVSIQEQSYIYEPSQKEVRGVLFIFDKNNRPNANCLQKNFLWKMVDEINIYLGKDIITYIKEV